MKSNYRDTFDEWFKETTVLSDTAALFAEIYYELRCSMEDRMAELISDDEEDTTPRVDVKVVHLPSNPEEAARKLREAIEQWIMTRKDRTQWLN